MGRIVLLIEIGSSLVLVEMVVVAAVVVAVASVASAASAAGIAAVVGELAFAEQVVVDLPFVVDLDTLRQCLRAGLDPHRFVERRPASIYVAPVWSLVLVYPRSCWRLALRHDLNENWTYKSLGPPVRVAMKEDCRECPLACPLPLTGKLGYRSPLLI